jgi:hypothetical protein
MWENPAVRSAFLLIVFAALLAGCSGTRATQPPRPSMAPLDPNHMRSLPAQGIVVSRKHDLLLVGLNGKTCGRLVGFKLGSVAKARRSQEQLNELYSLASDSVLVASPDGRHYLLGGLPAHLEPVSKPKLPLENGYALAGPIGGEPFHADPVFSLERGGKAVVRSTKFPQLLPAEQLIQIDRFVGRKYLVVGFRSGRKWTLPEDCAASSVHGGALLAVCAAYGPNAKHVYGAVTYFGRDGEIKHLAPIALPMTGGPILSAQPSPNGRHLLVGLASGCGPGYAYVLSTTRGSGRAVTGERAGKAPIFNSSELGWSSDGRAVFRLIRPSSCDVPGRAGVYLVDPSTFKRTFVYPEPSRNWPDYPMWNPAPPSTQP